MVYFYGNVHQSGAELQISAPRIQSQGQQHPACVQAESAHISLAEAYSTQTQFLYGRKHCEVYGLIQFITANFPECPLMSHCPREPAWFPQHSQGILILVQLGDPEGGMDLCKPKFYHLQSKHHYVHYLLRGLERPDLITCRWVLGLEGANQRHFHDNDWPFFPQAKQTLSCLPVASELARLACVQPPCIPPLSHSDPRTQVKKQTRSQPRTNITHVTPSPAPLYPHPMKPQTCHAVKKDLKLLSAAPPPRKCWDYRQSHHALVYVVWGMKPELCAH